MASIRVYYRFGRVYGNGTTPKSCIAKLRTNTDHLSIRLTFDPPAKGVGTEYKDSDARVTGGYLSLNKKQAEALANGILQLLALDKDGSVQLDFSSGNDLIVME